MKKFMRDVRAAVRFSALLVWVFALLPVALVSQLIPAGRAARAGRLTRLWARGSWRIVGGRTEVVAGAAPSGGGLVVANHLSYLDIMVHAALFPVRFAPKIEMRKWPLVGMMTGFSRPVWIDRRRRNRAGGALNAMREALAGDVPLLVYPEGTNGAGDALLPFKTTCFAAAILADAPIYPVLTRYLPVPDGRVIPWGRADGFLPHFWQVLGLKEIRCQVYIMPLIRPGRCDRKELTALLHDDMAERYRRWNEHA